MSSAERDKLLVVARQQGQQIRIPDLHGIFSTWPQDTNEHVADIVPEWKEILQR
jgi:hypothetical protein